MEGLAKAKRLNKPALGHFEKANVEPKRMLSEFLVSPDCVLDVVRKIKAMHFVPGQVLMSQIFYLKNPLEALTSSSISLVMGVTHQWQPKLQLLFSTLNAPQLYFICLKSMMSVCCQLIDVCGTSKGKGFAGAMKRHNFGGGRATHGNSLSHRILGSTGIHRSTIV